MKLIILLLLSFNASAMGLGQYYSSPDGSSSRTFKITKDKVSYQKSSNFFDATKDFTLGQFSSEFKLSSEQYSQLEEVLNKIKVVDEFMKKKGSSFNELSLKKPHESFIILDDYRISKKSDLYPELKKMIELLESQKWKQVSGIKVSSDFKQVHQIKNGKEVSQEAFNFAFHCKKSEPPSVCAYKDYGILYLK